MTYKAPYNKIYDLDSLVENDSNNLIGKHSSYCMLGEAIFKGSYQENELNTMITLETSNQPIIDYLNSIDGTNDLLPFIAVSSGKFRLVRCSKVMVNEMSGGNFIIEILLLNEPPIELMHWDKYSKITDMNLGGKSKEMEVSGTDLLEQRITFVLACFSGESLGSDFGSYLYSIYKDENLTKEQKEVLIAIDVIEQIMQPYETPPTSGNFFPAVQCVEKLNAINLSNLNEDGFDFTIDAQINGLGEYKIEDHIATK